MTSKEALNRLMILARPCAYEVREHRNSYCDRLENVIEQDLDRLETLELNLDSEKYHLFNENQSLKNRVEDLEICFKVRVKENEKLKKALEILKEYLNVGFGKGGFPVVALKIDSVKMQDFLRSMEEYKLLKEVLEDEK